MASLWVKEGGGDLFKIPPPSFAGDFFNFILIKVLIMAGKEERERQGKKGGPFTHDKK